MVKIYGDYHTHTRYSEGTGTVRENIEAARAIGLKELGIADHGYNNAYFFSLNRRLFRKQKREIEALRQEYKDINIFSSIEADLIGLDGTIDMELEELHEFDYIIGGFHRWARPKSLYDFRKLYMPVYRKRDATKDEIIRNTDAAINMLKRYPIAIFPHINSATVVDVKAVAEACADLNVLVELNEKHIEKNLMGGNMERIIDSKANMIISSDAHFVKRVGVVDTVMKYVKSYGLGPDRIVNLRQETPKFRTINNWKG